MTRKLAIASDLIFAKLCLAARRENAELYLNVIARSEATKQSILVAAWIASLTLAMTIWCHLELAV